MSKLTSIEEIMAGWDDIERPQDGQKFQHYKGGEYIIVATGFIEDSETPCVIYKSLKNDIVWVRSAKNFFEMVEHSGAVEPRFKKID